MIAISVTIILIIILFLYFIIPPIVVRASDHKETEEELEYTKEYVESLKRQIEYMNDTIKSLQSGIKPRFFRDVDDQFLAPSPAPILPDIDTSAIKFDPPQEFTIPELGEN